MNGNGNNPMQGAEPPAWAQKAAQEVSQARSKLGLDSPDSFITRIRDSETVVPEKPANDKPQKQVQQKTVEQKAEKTTSQVKEEVKPTTETKSPLEEIEETLKAEIDPQTEKKEEVEVQKPEDATQKNGKAEYKWGELRAKADKYDVEVPQLRKELEEARAASRTKEYEELQKQHDAIKSQLEERTKKLASYEITEDPIFQNDVAKPIDERYDFLQALAKEHTIDFEALERAMEIQSKPSRNAAIDDILDNAEKTVGSVSRADAARAISEIFELRQYGAKLQKDAQRAMEAIKLEREKESKTAKEASQREFLETANASYERLAKSFKELQDPNMKGELEKMFKSADEMPAGVKAFSIMAAKLLPLQIKAAKAAEAESKAKIQELETRIAQLTGGGPSIARTSTSSVEKPVKNGRPEGVDFADWLRSAS